jgi:hypothetical protein
MSGDFSFPECSNETQDLKVLLIPGNQIAHSDFVIDDTNFTGFASPYALIDLSDHEAYDSYCIDRAYNGRSFMGTVAMVCETRLEIACKTRACISHCCPKGNVINGRNYCDWPMSPDFYPEPVKLVTDNLEASVLPSQSLKFLYDHPPTRCEVQHKYEEYYLLESGKALVGGIEHSLDDYCVEIHEDEMKSGENNTNISYTYMYKIMVCKPEDPFSQGHLWWVRLVDWTIVPILFVISLCFLGLLFIYMYIKSRQKLFGVMTLCLIAMLSLFYVVVIVLKLDIDMAKNHYGLCITAAFMFQFFYLSAIFWLNAISFDMWRTFRKIRGHSGDHNAPTGWRHKRFKWYALYSWGCPAIIVAVTALMEFLPKEMTEGAILPQIGLPTRALPTRCLLEPKLAMIVYLNIVVAPLVCLNILMFASLAWNLCCGIWADKSGDPALRKQQKTRYVTVVKMFFAMGITWLTEVIAHALDWSYGPKNVRPVVTTFKIINSLQGLILFCVIVFDAATIKAIKHKLQGTVPTRSSLSTTGSRVSKRRATSMSRISSMFKSVGSRKKGGKNGGEQEAMELKEEAVVIE